MSNSRIRKITISTGIIATIVGNGASSFVGDGSAATSANLYPSGVAVDTSGNIYIADNANHRVRKLMISTGIISTIAGTGSCDDSNYGGGGAATSATLCSPADVALDASGEATNFTSYLIIYSLPHYLPCLFLGNVYFSLYRNKVVVKVSSGVIVTIAGTDGSSGFSGDGGLATSAELDGPYGIALDSAGNQHYNFLMSYMYNSRLLPR